MPISSAQFNQSDASIRAHYHSMSELYTQWCRPGFTLYDLSYLNFQTPCQLLYWNLLFQTYFLGNTDQNRVFTIPNASGLPLDTIPNNIVYTYGVRDQLNEIPDNSFDFPRARYKIQKCYWTGCSRRRRNR